MRHRASVAAPWRSVLALLMAATVIGTLPATAAETTPHEPTDRLASALRWQPLDGPPGGNTHFLEQDHVRPRQLYVGTGRGLYRSEDRGDTWRLLAPSLTEGVSSIAFGRPAAIACASGGTLRIEPDTDEVSVIGPVCHTLAARGHTVYASRNSEQLGVDRVRLDRIDLRQPDAEWVEITPAHDSWAELAEDPGSAGPFLAVDHLVRTRDRLFASVVRSGGPGALNRVATRLFASGDDGATWSSVDPGLPPDLPLQRLIHDPVRGTLVALGHENRSDGAFQPISRLARISRDDGRTWRPLTTIKHIASPAISDVDLVGKRTVLSGVDQSVLELRGRDREVARWSGPAVKGYTIRFPIEELLYDRTDPKTVFARGAIGWEGIIRSRDRGRTWERLAGGMAAAPTANLTVHPTDADTFVASGNLGYLPHVTRDRGSTWQPLVGSSNMADEVAYDPADPEHMVMISEITDIFESRDAGRRWKQVARHFTADRVHDLAVSSDGDTIYSANLGTNVSRMDGLRPGGEPLGGGERFWHNLLGSPDYAYALAAGPENTLFASQSPRKFEDHASVWRYRRGDPRDSSRWSEVLRVEGATGITDLVMGPGRSPVLYAGVTGDAAGVWASQDLGSSWAPVHADGFDFVTVHAVALDPTDPQVAYAAPWGAGLYRTTDGGESWAELAAPTVSAAAVLVDGADPQHILLGDRTRPAVWELFDRGDSWSELIEFDPDGHYRVMAMAQARDGLYVSLLDRAGPGLAVFAGAPDTGTTFRLGPDGPHRIEGLSRSALAFAEGEDGLYAVGHIRGIYRIRDDRAQDITADLPPIGFNDVLVHDGEVLVAGGVDLGADLQPVVRDPGVTHNIYRRTEQGWQPMLEDDPFKSPIKHLEADPDRPGILHAATASRALRLTRWRVQLGATGRRPERERHRFARGGRRPGRGRYARGRCHHRRPRRA